MLCMTWERHNISVQVLRTQYKLLPQNDLRKINRLERISHSMSVINLCNLVLIEQSILFSQDVVCSIYD